jgi:hypothetical protein
MQPSAVDELGLSASSIDKLRHFNDNYDNALLGLERFLLYGCCDSICSKISQFYDMVQAFNERISPECPFETDTETFGKTLVSDRNKTRTILAEINQQHPELAGSVRLDIGRSAIRSFRRDIVDDFQESLKFGYGSIRVKR